MPARRAEDLWQQLVGEAGEGEIERAAGVSVAQAEKELAEAGFDVAAERAKATALAAEMGAGSTASAKGASRATRRRVVAVGAALLVAVAIAVIAAVIAIPRGDVASPVPVGELKKRAAEIRRDAFAACDAQRYRDCETRLDEARALDPEGEQATEVQARRRQLLSAPRGP